MSTAIKLSALAAPKIIEEANYDTELDAMVDRAIAVEPAIAPAIALESEPARQLLRVAAYHRTLDRVEFNDRAKGQILALATGTDLDHLGALPFYNVTRLVVQPADDTAIPPIPLIMESDDDFRERIQLSLDGASAAGPAAAYERHARGAHGGVRAAKASSSTPGHVVVHVLGRDGNGTPSAEVLQAVNDRLQEDDVRQLCATVEVQPAEVLTYQVTAALILLPGPDQSLVVAAAQAAIEARVKELHAMSRDITMSALTGPLDQPGVQEVILAQPSARIEVDNHQSAFCSDITLTVGGRDV